MDRGIRRVAAGLVLLSAATVTGWVVYDVAARPVLEVNVTGSFEQVSRMELERTLAAVMAPGFFAVDVRRIQEAATALPWVRQVHVRRSWPNSVEINVEERVAVARWGDAWLMEADGTLFRPTSLYGTDALPRLRGPEGGQKRVLRAWTALGPAMDQLPAGRMHSIRLSSRGDWHITLQNGLELVTDQEPGRGLLVRIAPSLAHILGERLAQVERIDMRYGSGFAVRWRAQAQAQEGNGAS